MVNSIDFREKHKSKGAPLAMTAFASEVSANIVRHKQCFFDNFHGLEMVVPVCQDGRADNPHLSLCCGAETVVRGLGSD